MHGGAARAAERRERVPGYNYDVAFTAEYPGAIVVEAAQYGYGKPNVPRAWCLHTPEEPADDNPLTPYYFHNLTDRRASTTYFVSYLGFVFQLVPESEGAYANARVGVPGRFAWETAGNLNLQTLSVEIEGYAASIHATMPVGSAQWRALVALLAHRCAAHGFAPERTFGHYQVSASRSDPGTLDIGAVIASTRAALGDEEVDVNEADFARIRAIIREELAGVWPVRPVLPAPGRTYTVQEGDSLWAIAARLYGDGARYPEIQAANGLTEASTIHPGDSLVIP